MSIANNHRLFNQSGIISIFTLLFMRETYAVVLLNRKAARLRRETGNLALVSKSDLGMTPTVLFKHSLIRPLKILLLSPIVLALSVFCAFIFGLTFLPFTTFPSVFEEQYGFSSGITGLAYLGLGIGSIFGVVLFSVLSDKILKKQANGGEMKPEYRLPLMVYFTPVMPVGFFWYGWSAQAQVHWIVPILGTMFIGIGALFVIVGTLDPTFAFPHPKRKLASDRSCLDASPGLPRRRFWTLCCLGACRHYSPALFIRDLFAPCWSSNVRDSRTGLGKYLVGVFRLSLCTCSVVVLQVW